MRWTGRRGCRRSHVVLGAANAHRERVRRRLRRTAAPAHLHVDPSPIANLMSCVFARRDRRGQHLLGARLPRCPDGHGRGGLEPDPGRPDAAGGWRERHRRRGRRRPRRPPAGEGRCAHGGRHRALPHGGVRPEAGRWVWGGAGSASDHRPCGAAEVESNVSHALSRSVADALWFAVRSRNRLL